MPRRPGSHGVGWGWFLVVWLVLMWGLVSSPRVVAQEQPVFGDVTEGAFYEEGVASLAGEDVFDGTECEEGMFCPQRPLLRWEMAVWVVRVVDGGDPAAIGESRFRDVETGVWFAPFVERMFLLEVTRGCGDDRFCPHDVVTRGQMAAFLTRAFGLSGGPDPGFVDVPAGAPFFDEVAALAASGITRGCGDGGFCPDRVTSRGEMATFLYRGMTASDEGDGTEGAGGVGGFGDVVAGGAHAGDIATLGGLGVLEGTGCAEGLFCGSDPIRRWALAVWLARVLYDGEPPAATVGRFEDVGSDRWWAPHVEGLVSVGVTAGCSAEPLLFCPDEVVTRGQMASFLVRAFGLPTAGDAGFVDVADSSHRSDIDALSAAGVTSGCSVEPLRYCPEAATTRGQMASFLTRAVNYRAGGGDEAGADVLGGGGAGPVRRAPVRVAIESDLEGTATGRFNVVLRFSRVVTTRFGGNEVTAVNGTVSVPEPVVDDPVAWVVAVIPDTGLEGDVTVTVAEGTGGIREAVSRSFPVDTLVPTVEISAAPGPHSEPFAATFRWSEPVDGFDDGDVTVVGGSLGTLTTRTAGRVWTATVTPDDRRVDDAVVSVPASAVTDRLGNPFTEGSARFAVDTVPPTFTRANITGDSLVMAVSETLTSAPSRGSFAVTATDHVTSVETQPGVDSVSMEGQVVTVTLDTAVRHDDTVTVVYTPGSAPPEDSAGNPLAAFDMAASNDTAEATDNTLSSLTFAPVAITFDAQTVNYDVEVVKTVSEGTITAAAADTRASVAFSGAVTAGGTAFDLSPGANLATVTVTAENGDTRDYTITINREQDTEVPTVAISGPSTTQKEAFTVTFTWSETVLGFTSGDVTLSSGSLSGFAPGHHRPVGVDRHRHARPPASRAISR